MLVNMATADKKIPPRRAITFVWFSIPALALLVAFSVIAYGVSDRAADRSGRETVQCITDWAQDDYESRTIRTQASIEKSQQLDRLIDEVLGPKAQVMTAESRAEIYRRYVEKRDELAAAQALNDYRPPSDFCGELP